MGDKTPEKAKHVRNSVPSRAHLSQEQIDLLEDFEQKIEEKVMSDLSQQQKSSMTNLVDEE